MVDMVSFTGWWTFPKIVVIIVLVEPRPTGAIVRWGAREITARFPTVKMISKPWMWGLNSRRTCPEHALNIPTDAHTNKPGKWNLRAASPWVTSWSLRYLYATRFTCGAQLHWEVSLWAKLDAVCMIAMGAQYVYVHTCIHTMHYSTVHSITLHSSALHSIALHA